MASSSVWLDLAAGFEVLVELPPGRLAGRLQSLNDPAAPPAWGSMAIWLRLLSKERCGDGELARGVVVCGVFGAPVARRDLCRDAAALYGQIRH